MRYLEKLNPEQKEAVLSVEGPVLVFAGAGSGKTRVVTTRIAHMLDIGISSEQILGLTFTNKAAGEMQERVMALTSNQVLISTFHSLGARILRQSIEALGFQRHFSIYDEEDVEKLLSASLEKFGVKEKRGGVRLWRSLISRAKNDLKNPEECELEDLTSDHQALFPFIYRDYLERLKHCNAVDFDDLLYLPVKLLQEHRAHLEFYQNRWTHLLIDEYQDTNLAQYALLRLLVEKSRNLFVVGDPDQSIYSWRGANIHNIFNFERDYEGAKVIQLEQNYRSRTTILRAANALIRHNPGRYEKKLWSERGEGAKVGRYSGYSERDEARFIASRLVFHLERNEIPLKEMVVFYRTNAQSRPFEDQFLALGIPYVIVGGISFYQRKEVKDVLAFLRLVVSDRDAVAFARVLNVPKRGIGETSLEKIIARAESLNWPIVEFCQRLVKGDPLAHIPGLATKGRQGVGSFIELITSLRECAKENSLGEIVKAIIERSHYLDYLKEDSETFEERKENLDALIAKAIEWELGYEKGNLELFLEELSLKSSQDEAGSNIDKVNLMTVHHGKGLEFAVAVVAGLEEDLFPHVNARGSEEKLEEERRLCYVGMTRAKDYLYLTDSQVRYLWGTERLQRPSRFLKEIPPEFLERVR